MFKCIRVDLCLERQDDTSRSWVLFWSKFYRISHRAHQLTSGIGIGVPYSCGAEHSWQDFWSPPYG